MCVWELGFGVWARTNPTLDNLLLEARLYVPCLRRRSKFDMLDQLRCGINRHSMMKRPV